MVVPCKPTNITIELRANVIELVEYGDEFLSHIVIEESWQVEGQQIEHFTAIQVDLLDAPSLPSNGSLQRAFFESQRSQFRLQSMLHMTSSLCEADCHFIHADVGKLGHAVDNVLAEDSHGRTEIENAARHDSYGIRSQQSLTKPREEHLNGIHTWRCQAVHTCIDHAILLSRIRSAFLGWLLFFVGGSIACVGIRVNLGLCLWSFVRSVIRLVFDSG